ncbi:hypothetical protein LTR17_023069 [Elasticomyces elasticus]|nr:hypothetical protein LTR17_023069 [Elasticomyces elasticus]
MIDGSVTEWQNGGQIPSSGSAFQWNWKGNVSTGGSSRGACVEYGSLYGLRRADYIVVEPATNKAWTWFNVCPDGIGAATPNLPSGAPPVPAAGSKLPTGVSVVRTTTVVGGKTTVFTNTLVPTTTTNSQGATIIGTITKGPQPTTTFPITSLKTYTTFPPTVLWTKTTASYNTHDSQSSPVLAPWPLCWFCGPDTYGIRLSGLLPGVYPAGGPPSGMPTPFPRLTIHPDGTPEYSSKDDSCPTATVTDYWVSCDVDETSCTTTSSAVISGCSATPTVFTTAPGCNPLVDYDADQGDNGILPTLASTTAVSTGGGSSPAPSKTLPPPVVTVPSSYPTQTPGSYKTGATGYAFCYSSKSGDVSVFSYDDYMDVASLVCSSRNTLTVASGYVQGITIQNGYGVYATASYATDQTGCPAKASWALADTTAHQQDCINDFLPTFYCNAADLFDGSNSYGGAWVLKMPNVGCVLLQLYALKSDVTSGNNKRDIASNGTSTGGPFTYGLNNNTLIVHGNGTVANFELGGAFPGKFSAVTGLFSSDIYQVPKFGTHAFGAANSSLALEFGDGIGSGNMSVPQVHLDGTLSL